MKKIILLMFALVSITNSNNINICVIGQSNAVGQGTDTNYDVASSGKCQVWNNITLAFETISEPSDNRSNVADVDYDAAPGGSMLTSIANRLSELYPSDTIRLIPCARGSTGLVTGGSTQWRLRGAGTLFHNAISKVQTALGGDSLDYIVWRQGETDADASITQPTYLDTLRKLDSDFRDSLNNQTLTFLTCALGRVSSGVPDNWWKIDAALQQFDNGTTRRFGLTTIDLTVNVDGLHTSTSGQIIAGRRIANFMYGRSRLIVSSAITSGNTTQYNISGGSLANIGDTLTGWTHSVDGSTLTTTTVITDSNLITSYHTSTPNGAVRTTHLYPRTPLVTKIPISTDSIILEQFVFVNSANISTWNKDSIAFSLPFECWGYGDGANDISTGLFPVYMNGKTPAITATINGANDVGENPDAGYKAALKTFVFDTNTSIQTTWNKTLSNTSSFTIEAWLKFTERKIIQTIATEYDASANRWFFQINDNRTIYFITRANGILASALTQNKLENGGIYHLVASKDSSRLRIFINGVEAYYTTQESYASGEHVFTNNARIGLPATNINPFIGEVYTVTAYNGWIGYNNVIKNYEIGRRYGNLVGESLDSNLINLIPEDFSGEMGIDTLTFTCSAENALTYQWFLDGAEMVGETDSVVTIYADSAFYATVHTLYCLVNGTIVSDSWIIRETQSATGSRWSAYKAAFKSAYKPAYK